MIFTSKKEHCTVRQCIFFYVLFIRIINYEKFQREAQFFKTNNVMRENTTLAHYYSCCLNSPV